jgi:hypothetical protein
LTVEGDSESRIGGCVRVCFVSRKQDIGGVG